MISVKHIKPVNYTTFVRPKRISEANIQAECYHRLRNLGINCYLEYKLQHCRLDMVIVVNENTIACIVEFKSRTKDLTLRKGKQYTKYKALGFPLLYCHHMDEIDATITLIQHILKQH